MHLIHHFLEQSAERFPGKTALIHGNVRATYEEIENSANHFCQWLLDSGVKAGERVVLLLENSFEYVVSYYGLLKAGAVAVPLSTDSKPNTLDFFFAEIEPAAVISSSRFERVLHAADTSLTQRSKYIIKNRSSLLSESGLEVTEFNDVLSFGTGSRIGLEFDENSLASIIYTSGSTGRPKGAMLSHRNIVSNTNAICSSLSLTENDIQMVVLPFFYVMGKSLLNTHVAVGATVVLNNRFAYPAAVLKEMAEEQVTGFSGVPSTYAFLLYRSPLVRYRTRLQSLRYCSQAGGHMPRRIKEELRKVLPSHTQIYVMYGATEASARLTCLESSRFEDKMDSIGKPVDGVTLKVFDKKGNAAGVEEPGELVASGPNIMKGYWKDPQTTAGVIDEKGYHTGDIGHRDSEGFFFIQGRKDNLLKVGGHKINPTEVEEVILASDMAIEAVVVGMPHILLGQEMKALVTPKDGSCRAKDIMGYCAENLPKYKIPSDLILVKSLPKKSSGKIDREKCAKILLNAGKGTLSAGNG